MSSMDRAFNRSGDDFCDPARGAPPGKGPGIPSADSSWSRFLTTGGYHGAVSRSDPPPAAPALDGDWEEVREALPEGDPEALRWPGGGALHLGLSADASGAATYQGLGAATPLGVVGMGPRAALEAFGALAHGLGVPALGFACAGQTGTAAVARWDADPDFQARLAARGAKPWTGAGCWELPPEPEPGDPEAFLLGRIRRAQVLRPAELASCLDSSIGGSTWLTQMDAEAAVFRLDAEAPAPGSALALVMEAGAEEGDPFWGAAEALARVYARLSAVGARPLGFRARLGMAPDADASVRGMQRALGLRQACLSLEGRCVAAELAPGGPALLLAGVGHLEACVGPVDIAAPDAKGLGGGESRCAGWRARQDFEGLFLLGELPDGAVEGPALDLERGLQECVREGVEVGLIRSAGLVGAGGLAGAAHRATRGRGAHLFLPGGGRPWTEVLGSEAPGRCLVTVAAAGESALRTLCVTHRVPLAKVGVTGGGRFLVSLGGDPVADLEP